MQYSPSCYAFGACRQAPMRLRAYDILKASPNDGSIYHEPVNS
jgi:hypothetical protein